MIAIRFKRAQGTGYRVRGNGVPNPVPRTLCPKAIGLTRQFYRLLVAAALMLAMVLIPEVQAQGGPGGLRVTSLASQSPEELVNTLLGGGVAASNVVYRGTSIAAGTFAGGTGIIGFESGIVLSSGSVHNVKGPNRDDGITTVNGSPGDRDLESLGVDLKTFDAVSLEFDFTPENDVISFQYVFASDEYNDFVGSPFNDVFAFFLNGVNLALVPGTSVAVSVNTVNKGKPFGSRGSASHPEFYINNDLDDGGGAINTEMDGLTSVLTVQAEVVAGQPHHIKLAIADAGDRLVDSAVFIKAGSFVGTHQPIAMDDFATTAQDTPVDVDVLVNDYDIDGDRLTVASVTQGASGVTSINPDGTVRYAPNPAFTGVDTFSYTASDGDGAGTATVTVQVLSSGGNSPGGPGEPIVVNDMIRLEGFTTSYSPDDPRAAAGVFTVTATFTNVSSRELSALQFVVATLSEGNVVLNADGAPGGVGARISVPRDALGDGALAAGESFAQAFEIGLAVRRPFSFFVNAFGIAR
jgi:hypothetical protein